MPIDAIIRSWIVDIIRARASLAGIAVRQRAKFEGWLKFELAAYAEARGASAVRVEAGSADSGQARYDLAFHLHGRRYVIELKTCNTNWQMDGVPSVTRPITKNIAAIVADARRLQSCQDEGVVAFCMFPVRAGDDVWTKYLTRIADDLRVSLPVASHSARVAVSVGAGRKADIVVVVFVVQKRPGAQSRRRKSSPSGVARGE